MTALRLPRAWLSQTPARTFFVSLAVGSSLAVVLLLEGFQSGLYAQMQRAVLRRGADLIVAQAGVANFLASRSKLPQNSRSQVESVAGVAAAYPLTMVPIIFEGDYRRSPILLVVHQEIGGADAIVRGSGIQRPREIVIDESLASLYGIEPGDPFRVGDFEFRVAGIARGAAAMFTAMAFATYDDLLDFYFSAGVMGDVTSLPLVSFLLVRLAEGADRTEVAAAIEASVPSADVFLPEVLAQNDVAMGRSLFGPVMGAVTAVAYGVCLLVIGLVLYVGASARRGSLGVLKALGFRTSQLAAAMCAEGIGLFALSIPLALILAVGVGHLVEAWAPLYTVDVLVPGPLLRSFLAGLGLTLVGWLAPVRLVRQLDPADAFRSLA
jgi:putative ABC transport system permease protein